MERFVLWTKSRLHSRKLSCVHPAPFPPEAHTTEEEDNSNFLQCGKWEFKSDKRCDSSSPSIRTPSSSRESLAFSDEGIELVKATNPSSEPFESVDYAVDKICDLEPGTPAAEEEERRVGYVSFAKGLVNHRDLEVPVPEELNYMSEDEYPARDKLVFPKRNLLIKELDRESQDFISELVDAQRELKEQGFKGEKMKRPKRSSKSSLNYKLWPRSQWPNLQ